MATRLSKPEHDCFLPVITVTGRGNCVYLMLIQHKQ